MLENGYAQFHVVRDFCNRLRSAEQVRWREKKTFLRTPNCRLEATGNHRFWISEAHPQFKGNVGSWGQVAAVTHAFGNVTQFPSLSIFDMQNGRWFRPRKVSKCSQLRCRYLRNFNDGPARNESGTNRTLEDHVEEILRNPLAMFRVIHRLALVLRSLKEQWSPNNVTAGQAFLGFILNLAIAHHKFSQPLNSTAGLPPLLMTELSSRFGNESFPLRYDLAEAADAILRIQFMYSLNSADVRNFEAGHESESLPTSATQCSNPNISDRTRTCVWNAYANQTPSNSQLVYWTCCKNAEEVHSGSWLVDEREATSKAWRNCWHTNH